MFTGIVSEIGTVRDLERTPAGIRMSIAARDTRIGLGEGDSVAVNGVCLTAVTVDSEGFTADVVTGVTPSNQPGIADVRRQG